MFPPGSLISSLGRPESMRKTTRRQRSARERLTRSLLKEERCSYLTCHLRKSCSGLSDTIYLRSTRIVTILASIPPRHTLVSRTPSI